MYKRQALGWATCRRSRGPEPGEPDVYKRQLLRYLAHRVEVLEVDIRKNVTATEETILREKPDAVILATGAVPAIPALSGLDSKQAVTAWDILEEKAQPGQQVAIIGGGLVGCETASYLAARDHLSLIHI